MSNKRTWILVVFLVGIIVLSIALGAGYYLIFYQPVTLEKGTVVEIVLEGPLQELPFQNPLGQIFQPGPSLWELGKAFQYAAKDTRVSAIYLEIHPLVFSWAQIEELRDYMLAFRKAGKPIHAFLAVDSVSDSELYLASAADSITLNPDGGLLVNGLVAEVTFFKKTMDKLGIKPQFIQFKEYKSPENFTRESMTREIRAMLESILKDMEDRFVFTVAAERKLSREQVREILSQGVMPADFALKEKLVDSLGYKHEVQEKLETSQNGEKEYRGLEVSEYLQEATRQFRPRSPHKIALLGGIGEIIAGKGDPFRQLIGGTTMARQLRQIREDMNVKGVIFRVDSPGGSAVGSDMVWREIKLLEENDKPVVVSMASVAGSGGYYISMGASRIVTQPSTITGSIGVIFGKFDVTGFYEWLGMKIDRVKLAPNADILSLFTSLNNEQRGQVMAWMQNIYQNFVHKAADGRGMSYEEFEPKARGRIYTGVQAKEIGLVDDLGGLQAAIRHMREALNLKEDEEIELVLYPKPKSLWESLSSGDFFGTQQPLSLEARWEDEIRTLENPRPWLLTPNIRIY